MDPETQKKNKNGRAISLSFSFASHFVLASFSSKHFPNGKKKGPSLTIPHLYFKQSTGGRVSFSLMVFMVQISRKTVIGLAESSAHP